MCTAFKTSTPESTLPLASSHIQSCWLAPQGGGCANPHQLGVPTPWRVFDKYTGPALQAGPAVRWAVPVPFLVRHVARDLLDADKVLQAKRAKLAPIAAVLQQPQDSWNRYAFKRIANYNLFATRCCCCCCS